MSDHEHEHEPVRGLPERLPQGEQMLWQGSPAWRPLARRALHARKVGVYFALLGAWHVADVTMRGAGFAEAVRGAAWLVALGAAAIGVLALLAWALARSTVYTVTSKRVVLRFGIALPMSINLPLSLVQSVDMARHADGTADLSLTLVPGQRMGYFTTWPHVQPWRYFNVRPMLRALPDGELAARALTAALGVTEPVAPARTTREATTATPRPVTPVAA